MIKLIDRWLPTAFLLALIIALTDTLGSHGSLLRPLLAVPVVLLLPGYALARALFPAKALAAEVRLLLALALSIAALILGSLLLHQLSGEIHPAAQAVILGAITLLAFALSTQKRAVEDREERPSPAQFLSWSQSFLLGGALLVAILAFSIARQPARPSGSEGYTTLSIVPATGEVEGPLTLTIESRELAATEYRMALRANGRQLTEWQPIALEPGERWEVRVRFEGNQPDAQMIEGVLYRLDAPDTVYRHVRVWPDS